MSGAMLGSCCSALPLLHTPWAWLAAPWVRGGGHSSLDGGGGGAGAKAVVWVRGDGRAPRVGCPEKGKRRWRSTCAWCPGG
jgi:hypothetical protein